ncbi:glucose 1-dehydrogenase [Tessaracoccus antarcticus]|uniref:Glucose 1-dehydrogenase n=1 Tax=Tessaracoccus antarcticus TaxID=2479848 RepID=A0A3M0FYR1_9ACTN|nr:glucose 1-dehydrogenase [Tessaracoccus antarcticus]RMB57774.1 glucose 1-dehydrogenase [Tessaracoccus antarcticus]
MIDFGLRQEVALVTGASSGIGQAIALALGESGVAVGCAARSGVRAAETVSRIQSAGGRALAIEWDVTNPEQAAAAVASVEQRFGPLSLAVNNAGVGAGTPALELSPSAWQSVFDTNVNGVFYSCQAEARVMQQHGRGAIVNIASISATIANRNLTQVQYNSSKAAVVHLTKSLAVEWAPLGIRVNAVSPGYTLTPMNRRPEVADLVAEFADTTPLGRLADPQEIAGPVLFLLGPAASYITGVDLLVDGGYCCW